MRTLIVIGAVLFAFEVMAAPMVMSRRVTIVPLDASQVTTGGVAVTALAPGRRTAGGMIYNPIGVLTVLCINEIGPASGVTANGSTICIAPGTSYQLAPSVNPVSVVASDGGHQFAGVGYTE